jgi:hypothetical protein
MEALQSLMPVPTDWREIHMNVRTITRLSLAAALIATAGGVFAAERSGPANPYTGPDQAVITTGSNTGVTPLGRDSVYPTKDAALSQPDAANATDAEPKAGRA